MKTSTTEKIGHALRQAGVDWLTARELSAMLVSALHQRSIQPWWNVHFERIVQTEADSTGRNGRENLYLTIAGTAIPTIANDGPQCVGFAANKRVMEAVDQYRASIRHQWRTPKGVTPITSDIDLYKDVLTVEMDDSEDEPTITDPRLLDVLSKATPDERELLSLIASGVTVRQASILLGYSESWGPYRLARIRER